MTEEIYIPNGLQCHTLDNANLQHEASYETGKPWANKTKILKNEAEQIVGFVRQVRLSDLKTPCCQQAALPYIRQKSDIAEFPKTEKLPNRENPETIRTYMLTLNKLPQKSRFEYFTGKSIKENGIPAIQPEANRILEMMKADLREHPKISERLSDLQEITSDPSLFYQIDQWAIYSPPKGSTAPTSNHHKP